MLSAAFVVSTFSPQVASSVVSEHARAALGDIRLSRASSYSVVRLGRSYSYLLLYAGIVSVCSLGSLAYGVNSADRYVFQQVYTKLDLACSPLSIGRALACYDVIRKVVMNCYAMGC